MLLKLKHNLKIIKFYSLIINSDKDTCFKYFIKLQVKILGFQYKEQAIPLIHRAVIILTEISTSLTNELSKSRDICYASLRSHVDFSLGLIDSYVNHSG